MKNLFEMLQAIFGKNIISKTIGTRTNVIKLPTNKSSPLKNEFDVFKSAENPAVFEKLKKVIEDEAPYISRMNDAERLIYEGNVKRLHDYLVSIGEIKPAITAEVIGLTTKEPIAGKGLASLVEEAGQTSPPGTLIGDIQSRINRLKNLAKEEGTTMQDVVGDFASGQKGMLKLRDEGLVRATARQIMFNDIKSGKLKASKEVQDIVSGRASGDPLDSFRTIYGEDALEQLDSLTPDLRQLRTEVDAEKLARSKFEFTPKLDRPKESYTLEEMEKILKEGEEEGTKGLDYLTGQKPPEKKANGGRIGYAEGTDPKDDILNRYKAYLNDQSNNELYNLFRKAVDETPAVNLSSFIPIALQKRPDDLRSLEELRSVTSSEVDPFGRRYDDPRYYATGGRVGFSIGGGKKILDLIAEMNKKLKDKKSMEKLDPRTGEVTTPKEPVTTADKIKRKPTKEEYEEYAEILDDSENTVVQGNETFEQLDALVKKQKDYEDYMYMQYKRGKLDPEPGEKTQDRLNFLRKKSEEAGMIGDRRLFTFKEMKELEDLERAFSPMGTSNKINISDPETAESFTEFAKQNDPEGFKKIQKIVDDINNKNALEEFDPTGRKPNAKGGLNYLMGF